ncbi:hypothetical protein [Priestia aryabhattai]|uniref:hypothetical protein n=1 Tax=Priestia aryabhattai TaxID=412384 RepID=UPI001594B5B8
MSISNIDQYRKQPQSEAEKNYLEYSAWYSDFGRINSNRTIYTNIKEMKDKLDKLIEEGQLQEEEFDHTYLKGFIDTAVKLHQKTSRSLDDLTTLYSTYNDFNEVYNCISGDNDE